MIIRHPAFRRLRGMVIALSVLLSLTLSAAASAQVVAFGASNVLGWGVPPNAAYPAQLETMLRARGINVTVKNAGVYGDTSAAMLARLDAAIPVGTKVVILDTSGELLNDRLHGISDEQGKANLAAIMSRLAARNIVVIPEATSDLPMSDRQPDHIHLTPEGHQIVAARLLDSVTHALGKG
jgi:acyl-CoA thioesterase-1